MRCDRVVQMVRELAREAVVLLGFRIGARRVRRAPAARPHRLVARAIVTELPALRAAQRIVELGERLQVGLAVDAGQAGRFRCVGQQDPGRLELGVFPVFHRLLRVERSPDPARPESTIEHRPGHCHKAGRLGGLPSKFTRVLRPRRRRKHERLGVVFSLHVCTLREAETRVCTAPKRSSAPVPAERVM